MQQNDLLAVFKELIEQNHLFEEEEKIVLGLSGGVDSMTLLDLLFRVKGDFKITIIPVHVNHLLRDTATEESWLLAGEIKKKYGLDLVVVSSNIRNIAKHKKIGIEECGRIVRKKIFEEIADRIGAKKIALGHNMDDQAETLLFRFTRGTGIRGLCGMYMMSGRYIRPLLYVRKDDIKSYADTNGLFFIEDRSNYELVFDRNIIRHNIMPELTKINSKAYEHLAELSIRCQELSEFLDNKTKEIVSDHVIFISKSFMILKANFLKLGSFISKEVIRSIYEMFTGSISGVESFHIEKFFKEGLSKGYAKVQFPRDVVFTKSSDIILVSKKDFNKPEYEFEICNGVIVLPFGLGSLEIKDGHGRLSTFKIRGFKDGDIYRGMKLKHVLYEVGIPRVLRNLIPLLTFEKEILYVPIFDGNEFFFKDENTFFKLNFLEGELYSKILKRFADKATVSLK